MEDKATLVGRIEGAALGEFLDQQRGDSALLSFPPFTLCGREFDGIGCHYGLDRSLYYDLYSGRERIVSMNDWRLEDLLLDLKGKDLRSILSGMRKAGPPQQRKAQPRKARSERNKNKMKL